MFKRILIANRGEIACRIIKTARCLGIEKIVDACRRTGAEAVHPGYGFLSERAAFATALQAAGVVFIGPNPKAIAAMGDKIESKRAAAKAKVSTVPGYLGEISDAKHAVKI